MNPGTSLTQEMQQTIRALAMLLVSLTKKMKNTAILIPPKQMKQILNQIDDIIKMNFKMPQKMIHQLILALVLRFQLISDSQDCLILQASSLLQRLLCLETNNGLEDKLVVIFLHKTFKEFMHSKLLGSKQKTGCLNAALKMVMTLNQKSSKNLRKIFPGIVSQCCLQLKNWNSGKQYACALIKFLDEFVKQLLNNMTHEKQTRQSQIPLTTDGLLSSFQTKEMMINEQPEIGGLYLAMQSLSKNLKNLLREPKIAQALVTLSGSIYQMFISQLENAKIILFLLQFEFICSKFTGQVQINPLIIHSSYTHRNLQVKVKQICLTRIKHLKQYIRLKLGQNEEKIAFYQLEFSLIAVQKFNCYFNYGELQAISHSLYSLLEVSSSKQLICEDTNEILKHISEFFFQEQEAKMFKIFSQFSQIPLESYKIFTRIVKIFPNSIKDFIRDRALSYFQELSLKPQVKTSFSSTGYLEVNVFNLNLQIKSLVLISMLMESDKSHSIQEIKVHVCERLSQYELTAALEF